MCATSARVVFHLEASPSNEELRSKDDDGEWILGCALVGLTTIIVVLSVYGSACLEVFEVALATN